MSTRLLIIADDLTGALDTAVPFCSVNNKVLVAVSNEALADALQSDADIVAVSTRSREMDSEEAFEQVKHAVDLAKGIPIFKKVDSRLKGNLVSELNAIPDASFLVAPALPSFERVVINGHVRGFGVDDPIDIASALGLHASRSTIPDTVTEDDMDSVIASQRGQILIGARGLSVALARSMGIASYVPASLEGRTALAIGSTDPITTEQVEHLDRTKVKILKAPSGVYQGHYSGEKHVLLQAVKGARKSREEVAKLLAKSFKSFVLECDNLILSGGATAESMLDELGIKVLDLEGELLPGIPVAKALGWRVVTKSGGFGCPDVLSQLIET
ncbi:conserved hypothetical protein [Vibrio nigripulchritudo SOn1]|uniref:Four-carbon acid sugar kinase family protein n=1 Tax=Vibrio nigripulchritudo SOn1 TaxID=1238450 RepID=A0AAV2W004_9VIBR|nr:four-carbon acid sugar kinase family protein [Vibrio nigripulchritudo]CCO50307.1 conserved hypothetical protein [Vibrio nigripulchritudo SOn1]